MSSTNGTVSAEHASSVREEASTALADQLLDVTVKQALSILVDPTWNVHRRKALLVAIIGRLHKGGEFRSTKAGNWNFLEFDALRDRINPLAYRCGLELEYGQPDGEFTTFTDGKAESEAWVRAINYDNPDDVTNWSKSKGFAYQNYTTDDKTANKAQTQALKYATVKFLNIATGEPDGDDSGKKDQEPTFINHQQPASQGAQSGAGSTGGFHILSQGQITWLRGGLQFKGIDEAEFVRRNSNNFCSSLDDTRLQDRDVDRMLGELGYKRANGKVEKIASTTATNTQPQSTATEPAQQSTPQTQPTPQAQTTPQVQPAAAPPADAKPPQPRASATKSATEKQREWIKSLLTEAGVTFAEACAKAKIGPFADADDPSMKSLDASNLIEVLKPLSKDNQARVQNQQQVNRIAAQAAAALARLPEGQRNAMLQQYGATIESLQHQPDAAQSILRDLASAQANRQPREGFAAPASAAKMAVGAGAVDVGDANIPQFADEIPPW